MGKSSQPTRFHMNYIAVVLLGVINQQKLAARSSHPAAIIEIRSK
jgi:hypothetical protein